MASKKREPVIALAQIRYSGKSCENVEKIRKYIRLAKSQKADIVCFPESCISMHDRKDIFALEHKFACEIKEECKKNKIWCIFSDDFLIGKEAYNLSRVINRQGVEVGNYKKINLSGDHPKVKAGKGVEVFDTDFGKIGVVICWDLFFPELFKELKQKGAEIVFCPAQWHYEEEKEKEEYKLRDQRLLKSLITARAYENLFFVALCNPVTKRNDLVPYSAICSPHEIVKEIFNKEGLIVAKLKLKEINRLQKLYKFKK